MGKRGLGSAALAALLLCAGLAGNRPAAGQATARTLTATADCTTAEGGAPTFAVQITNQTGEPVSVVYVHSLATGQDLQAGLTGLRLADPGPDQTVAIPDGATDTLPAPWAGGPAAPGAVVAALVVTSVGVLLPTCGGNDQVNLPGPLPTDAADAATEGATLAAAAIGRLEAWRAYPALYALLHPDARALVPFETMACWYAAQYGPPVTGSARTIYSTTVTGVSFGAWTWPVTGVTYPQAAAVTYQQTSGVFPRADAPVTSTEHLVEVDGVWRWFFGSSRADLASLPTSCGLPATT